jgi:hypothetical protein
MAFSLPAEAQKRPPIHKRASVQLESLPFVLFRLTNPPDRTSRVFLGFR